MSTIRNKISSINLANNILLYIANTYIKNPISLKPVADNLGISQDDVVFHIENYIEPLLGYDLEYKIIRASGRRYVIFITKGLDVLKSKTQNGSFF